MPCPKEHVTPTYQKQSVNCIVIRLTPLIFGPAVSKKGHRISLPFHFSRVHISTVKKLGQIDDVFGVTMMMK
ncbi:hypothetical protein WN944_000709 [Citrus x changshan-huyou]|uniref:Uncharacterized protein n=1 Tax=Citrus x changshan-huyou TaxID=2935761 RepID=A0AAP0MF48_9ROSI